MWVGYANVQSRAPTVISGDPQQPLQLASGRSQNPSRAEVMTAGDMWSRNKRDQNQELGASENIGGESCGSLGDLAMFLCCFFCSLGWGEGGLLVQGSERPGQPGTLLRQAHSMFSAWRQLPDWTLGQPKHRGPDKRAGCEGHGPIGRQVPGCADQPSSLWVLKQSMERSGLLAVREETEKQRWEGGEKIQFLQVPDDKALT